MKQAEKKVFIDQMHTDLQNGISAVFLADFTGVSVAQSNRVRKALGDTNADMQVVKNRLMKIAVKGTSFENRLEEHLTGPNAVVLVRDVVATAKALKNLLKEEDIPLKIRGGALVSTPLSAKDIESLAEMPSREELLAKFMAQLRTPLYQFANLMAASLRDFVYVLESLKQKKEN